MGKPKTGFVPDILDVPPGILFIDAEAIRVVSVRFHKDGGANLITQEFERSYSDGTHSEFSVTIRHIPDEIRRFNEEASWVAP